MEVVQELDIQEKTLEINKEISNLQLQLAYLSESLMHPSSPFPATIQRILVRQGQAVSPSTPLAVISGSGKHSVAVVSVPADIAKNISNIEDSILQIGTIAYRTKPTFISQEATGSQLYSVIYDIPDEYQSMLTDGAYITVQAPIGIQQTSATDPFVPLDAVYQTQEAAFVFVAEKGIAVSKSVLLGPVYGNYVSVEKGLSDGDQIIMDRNVVSGDRVKGL
ncbi:hypothetical protein HGB07_03930 [Candidatus Roizmanbacteria bacterium]|nr:hypothetical protein [Candidatus Roizmanbacteria bacterium]